MKYERFEQLPVWQSAAELAARMFPWTKQRPFQGMGGLADQLQRSTLSVSNNIAKGLERGTTAELLTFLYYARGSMGEVRSMLGIMVRMPEFKTIEPDIDKFHEQAESSSRQLRAWASSLRNTDIKGTRYLNDQTKQRYERRQKQVELQERMTMFMKEKERELTEERMRKQEQR